MQSLGDCILGIGYLSGMVTMFRTAVVVTGAPGAILLGDQVVRGRPGRVGTANNTCFFECQKLGLDDEVYLRIQPPMAGEHWGGATCVNVVYYSLQGSGCVGSRSEQCSVIVNGI